MMNSQNIESELCQTVAAAIKNKTVLKICAGNSKTFLGHSGKGRRLDVSGHQGIINYHPSELLITARCGTPLNTIKQVLAEKGQMLAFEPPAFAPQATLGGTIACNLSGSRRPFTGSARDFVLGCKVLDGRGDVLSFGGEVMKNVAGYDVARLMAGAMGTLGVILEISLKVLPLPEIEMTTAREMPFEQAQKIMQSLRLQSIPVSAIAYVEGQLLVRFSGVEQAVNKAVQMTGGELLAQDSMFWGQLNEQRHEFFNSRRNLWRISVPPSTEPLALSGDWLFDWGGALRWLKSDEPPAVVFQQAARQQGHAVLFRPEKHEPEQIFQPLADSLKKLHHKLKKSFDPLGIFNPGRMYQDI